MVNVPNLLYLQRPRSNQRKQKKTSSVQTSTSSQNSYNFYEIKPSSNYYILVAYVQFNTSLNESLYRQKHIKEIMKFIDLAKPHEPRLLYIVQPPTRYNDSGLEALQSQITIGVLFRDSRKFWSNSLCTYYSSMTVWQCYPQRSGSITCQRGARRVQRYPSFAFESPTK